MKNWIYRKAVSAKNIYRKDIFLLNDILFIARRHREKIHLLILN